MSPRAAWRLVSLDYSPVFDYVAGKADWLAHGLPWHGTAQLLEPHVIRDVTTCHPHEPVAAVRQRLESGPVAIAIVVNDHDVVIGQLDLGALSDHNATVAVSQVMTEGPTTVRLSEELDPLLGRMDSANVNQVIVTSPDGRLEGVFRREGLQQHT